MQKLVLNPKIDLYARIPWGSGQTILREAVLVADHNGYIRVRDNEPHGTRFTIELPIPGERQQG